MLVISNKELRMRSFERIERLADERVSCFHTYKDEAVIIPFKISSQKKELELDRVRL